MQQFIFVADGTVPVVLARVLHTDGDRESLENVGIGFGFHNSDDLDVRMFEVEDEAQYVGISWADGDGFNEHGFETWVSAFDWLCDDEGLGIKGPSQVSPGHYVATINPGDEETSGDDEVYVHVFSIKPGSSEKLP